MGKVYARGDRPAVKDSNLVVGDGEFEYNGVKYTSLSRIAKIITGGHWNGKLFFGVK